MADSYVCKKDWYLNGEIHYREGKNYRIELFKKDNIRPGIHSALIQGEGWTGWFHSGSDYFDIEARGSR